MAGENTGSPRTRKASEAAGRGDRVTMGQREAEKADGKTLCKFVAMLRKPLFQNKGRKKKNTNGEAWKGRLFNPT